MKKENVLNLAKILGRMKKVKRNGWIKRRVEEPESDAEHSYSLAMLVMLFAPSSLDLSKCLQLALVHDLPEVFCGDFVPGEISEAEKAKFEQSAMAKVVKETGLPRLTELFEEYEQRRTPEAKFVWILDRLDNAFTARFYEDTQKIALVKEFSESAFERLYYLEDAELRKELDSVLTALLKK